MSGEYPSEHERRCRHRVHPRRACRHKRASRACSLGASARIEAVVRAGCRCWSQGGDERRRPPSRALLLSPRSTRARPGLGATAFVLVPARIALSQSHVLTCLAVARGRLLHPGDAQAEPLEAIRIRALSLLHASAYPSRPDRSSGSTIRVSDSRRAITDIASCPSLLFHGRSREVALLLPRGAVVRAAATASRARNGQSPLLGSWRSARPAPTGRASAFRALRSRA